MKRYDTHLMITLIIIQCIGFVVLASASMYSAEEYFGNAYHYTQKQAIFLLLFWGITAWVTCISLETWQNFSLKLYAIGIILLIGVLVIGKEVNGSIRWINLGLFNFQVSELIKIIVILYFSDYLVRYRQAVQETIKPLLGPSLLLIVTALLILSEPDLGSTIVICATVLGLFFLGGVPLRTFVVIIGMASLALIILIYAEPYRMQRVTSFMSPWQDPYGSGFQLTQSLIAFGRGDWFGVGLGNSVQKLLYLPEAHTDFIIAVLAEELGLLGVMTVLACFTLLIGKIFIISQAAEKAGQPYSALVAYGIGLWIGMQVMINLGVSTGLLPTKGLTLPFMSYGGSSLLVFAVAMGIIFRIDRENKKADIDNDTIKNFCMLRWNV